MLNPVSTYRVQLHKDFNFDRLIEIIQYLSRLGVKTIYASPVLEASPGSMHGYDGINPERINPEIGTEEQFRKISEMLRENGMAWLQDIVPNHMAFHPGNTWLMDVMELGIHSSYSNFFDIIHTEDLFEGRLMVPFMGSALEELVRNGEIRIEFNGSGFVFRYYSHLFPLRPESYISVLSCAVNPPESITQLIKEIDQLHHVEEHHTYREEWSEIKKQLISLMQDPDIRTSMEACFRSIHESPAKLLKLCNDQHYHLCHWQETDRRINYRRFFTINGLICLNIQCEEVFEKYHRYIKTMLDQGLIQGLRIDHIDGLYDPAEYLERLRNLAGSETYIVAEKILARNEELPVWPLEGNTGYDFLALLNNLQIHKKSESLLTEFYQNLTDNKKSVQEQIREKKSLILHGHMAGELDNLVHLFINSGLAEISNNVPNDILKKAIAAFLIEFPVYRFYGNQFPLEAEQRNVLTSIFSTIKKEKSEILDGILLLEQTLTGDHTGKDQEYSRKALSFYQRLMQFSGPLMAKGVEDTLMYTFNRFTCNNEVGDSPENFGISADEFHKTMIRRQQQWPLSMNASATHDTKRGEDVNARLSALAGLAEEWIMLVQEWHAMNTGLKKNGIPDPNDEYFLYQGLIGTFPLEEKDEADYPERLKAWLSKALREGKNNSSWTKPNTEYENGFQEFALALLDKRKPFWKSFQKFHRKVSDFGILNSLAKIVLKYTCPGIPDLYQGCELWDLSMVDPDNRRLVDYQKRMQFLEEFSGETISLEFIHSLWKSRSDGRIKLWLTQCMLHLRKEDSQLFLEGQYIPLKAEGKFQEHVFAFARRFKGTWLVLAVPLHPEVIASKSKKDVFSIDWKDTRILLPQEAPQEGTDLLFGSRKSNEGVLQVKELFKNMPFAILRLESPDTSRSAGILMHISSLPSDFGAGDFGPEARKFAEFLSRSGQKFWQILPLNITEAGNGHSPYSSVSGMAGNTLLLSPELMVEEGLLEKELLDKYRLPVYEADFGEAEKVREVLFEKAFQNFLSGNSIRKKEFAEFCEQEASWLDDFTLYVMLRQHHGTPWFQWPQKYKLRDKDALGEFYISCAEAIEKIKWLQFMFSRQWKDLKKFVNNLGIQFFGDLPFYVSYDSADVWANPEIFSLDAEGNITGVAGVPPDYFNSDGQLWGMPVFKWDVLKERKYDWWISRIKKNMELYDVLRLDHFRAFADYWEVPAGERTAINGRWKLGPGIDFFKALEASLGKQAFIAEDLGDINPLVHKLRDELQLPGMKVLQFAFSEDMPRSIYVPHNHETNYVAYTGTHDNNTTVGWFRQSAGKLERRNLERYTGLKPKEKNIHEILGRLAYASVAKTAMLPMQDVLGLDEGSRMNIPASTDKNWLWRLLPGQIKNAHEERLREWVRTYNR
ncbi:MAG: malto-oligosyltrehalose synthase [Cytophagaceae bacterium]